MKCSHVPTIKFSHGELIPQRVCHHLSVNVVGHLLDFAVHDATDEAIGIVIWLAALCLYPPTHLHDHVLSFSYEATKLEDKRVVGELLTQGFHNFFNGFLFAMRYP